MLTDADLKEAMARETPLRVFQNDLMIDSGGIIIRFDDRMVVVQSGVSQIAYHDRADCEFFEKQR